MGKNKDEIPYYMRNVPFFFLTALLAPVAVLLVLLNWDKLSTQLYFGFDWELGYGIIWLIGLVGFTIYRNFEAAQNERIEAQTKND